MLMIPARRDRTTDDATPPRDRIVDDIDLFDAAELDQLARDHAIDVPGAWSHWVATTKIAWLKAQFETEPEAAAGFRREPEAASPARGGSKVSLMTSLAALGNSIEGSLSHADGPQSHESDIGAIGAGSLAAWAPNQAVAGGRALSEASGEGHPDALAHLIEEIDGLDESDAVVSVGRLANQSEAALFHLGGVLARLKAQGWPKAEGSFKQFVEAEHDIPYRKAVQWMTVYRQLSESKVAWEKVRTLGWAKLKEIAGIITPDNVDEWVAVALSSKTAELVALVADHKNAGAVRSIAHQSAEPMTRMTFRLHSGQKGAIQAAIDKARGETGAQPAAAALETICANYLSGATFGHEAKAMGLDACLQVIEAAYPNAKIKVAFAETSSRAA